MLVPRFSLRWLLLATVVCAVLSLAIAQATRGSTWAAGLVVGMAFVPLVFGTYAVFFLVAWCLAWAITPLSRREPVRSPFAGATLPPQLLPPVDPE